MMNIRKISQIVLTAGAIIFAPFYANMQYCSNAYAADPSRKAQKADEKAQEAIKKSAEAYGTSSQAMAAQDDALQQAQQAQAAAQQQADAYRQSSAYTNAQENYKKAEAQRQANIAAAKQNLENYVNSVKEEQDAKVEAAQQKYDACVKQNGNCADDLVALNKTKAERTKAINDVENNEEYQKYEKQIATAELGDSSYSSAVAAKAMAEEQANEYDKAVTVAQRQASAAEVEYQKAKREGMRAANEAIEANKAKIAVAEKEKEKAQKEFDKAAADVENKCGKDPNSNACQKAKDKMNEASAAIKTAKETIDEANTAITTANGQKAVLNMDDEMADFDADLNAEFNAQMDAFDAAKDAAAQATAAETKQMTEQQKAASDAKTASEAYEAAVENYKKLADDLAEAQRNCSKGVSEACAQVSSIQDALVAAKQAADKAYLDKVEKEKIAKEKGAVPEDEDVTKAAQQALTDAVAKEKAAEEKVANLRNALNEAKSACEYSKTLTSKQGKADAEKYCGMVETLEKQLAAAEEELMQAQLDKDMAETYLEGLGILSEDSHEGQEFKAFSTATGSVEDGTYRGNIDYSNTQDIFTTMTRRAARIIVGLKPIVYVFAGFGLIGFAFMAIFNKISWKWFANIAIGLFLVANMGRLIEYMVYTKEDRALTADEKPTGFGDHLHDAFADTEYAWVDIVTPYVPPEVVEEGLPDTSVQPAAAEEKESDVRGFCEAEQKGSFFSGGFASCVKDLIASGKKAVDAVQTAQNTVDKVQSAAAQMQNRAEQLKNAINTIGTGDLEDTWYALGDISENITGMVNITDGMVDGVMSNASDITNDIQDISKSRAEQDKLQASRDKGEATSGVGAFLQGQTLVRDEDGNITGVEHRWGGDLEYDGKGNVVVNKSGLDKDGNVIEGDIASNKNNMQNNGQLGFEDAIDGFVDTTNEINRTATNAANTAGNLTGAVANFSAFGSTSINEAIKEK